MAFEIPILPNENAFTQRMQLDGEYYTLTLRWNARAERWYLDVGDGEGAMLAAGLALVAGVSMNAHLTGRANMPPGEFVCLDTSDAGIDPDFGDLGERVKLVYVEAFA